jgi:drug/metabolite transporter (DMT)-like permease
MSGIVWGGADFCGGLAARRQGQFKAVAASILSGFILLAGLAIVQWDTALEPKDWLWSLAAGVGVAIGLASLYGGLAVGNAAVVASTSAVVGAVLPVLLGSLFEGLPGPVQSAGLLVGIAGIWLVTRSASSLNVGERRGLWLAVLSGVGFGSFYVLIAQVRRGTPFAPLAIAKASALGLGLLALLIRRERMPSVRGTPLSWLAGALDAGGSVLYLLAQQNTRLDVATVLSSMHSVSTVLLARLILGQQVSKIQWLGVVLCLVSASLVSI